LTVQARGKGLALTHEISGDVPELLIGDAVRLKQILINLIGNAIKFSNAGGIGISVKRQPHSPPNRTRNKWNCSFQ
jgi:signal transduction histidine kinase